MRAVLEPSRCLAMHGRRHTDRQAYLEHLQAVAELIRHGLTLAGATPPQEDLEDEGDAWS